MLCFCLQHVIHQSKNICIIIVERISIDVAPFSNIQYRDFIKGHIIQQRQETFPYCFLRALRHGECSFPASYVCLIFLRCLPSADRSNTSAMQAVIPSLRERQSQITSLPKIRGRRIVSTAGHRMLRDRETSSACFVCWSDCQ